MEIENKLVQFVKALRFQEIPSRTLATVKNMLMTVAGTTIAGAEAEGCSEIRELYVALGGRAEATILVHGGKLPAQHAALVNGVMARALDYCDAMAPGLHIGSSLVPATLAAVDLRGGCSGEEFLTALTAGAELSSRLNLSESAYNGFDPTGVAGVFSGTAAASRILGLDDSQLWNALALAGNRSGATFQSNIDGSLAVRLIQGWVAATGIECARLAQKGITGPKNFLEGVYGYFHLFAKDQYDPETVTGRLGQEFQLNKIVFKKFPSCGLTQGVTELALSLTAEHDLKPQEISSVEVLVPPYAHKLVGHNFQIGDNPKVNAQFSIQYCVASAIVRNGSQLQHFEKEAITDPEVASLIKKIKVIPDPGMDIRGHTSVDLRVTTIHGREFFTRLDHAPGFPENPLSDREHLRRFRDCVHFAARPPSKSKTEELIDTVQTIEKLHDVRGFISLMT